MNSIIILFIINYLIVFLFNWSKGALNDFKCESKESSKETLNDNYDRSIASTSIETQIETISVEKSTDDSFADNVNSDFAKFDEMFSPLINSDPELKDHWNKLTKSCAEAGIHSSIYHLLIIFFILSIVWLFIFTQT